MFTKKYQFQTAKCSKVLITSSLEWALLLSFIYFHAFPLNHKNICICQWRWKHLSHKHKLIIHSGNMWQACKINRFVLQRGLFIFVCRPHQNDQTTWWVLLTPSWCNNMPGCSCFQSVASRLQTPPGGGMEMQMWIHATMLAALLNQRLFLFIKFFFCFS